MAIAKSFPVAALPHVLFILAISVAILDIAAGAYTTCPSGSTYRQEFVGVAISCGPRACPNRCNRLCGGEQNVRKIHCQVVRPRFIVQVYCACCCGAPPPPPRRPPPPPPRRPPPPPPSPPPPRRPPPPPPSPPPRRPPPPPPSPPPPPPPSPPPPSPPPPSPSPPPPSPPPPSPPPPSPSPPPPPPPSPPPPSPPPPSPSPPPPSPPPPSPPPPSPSPPPPSPPPPPPSAPVGFCSAGQTSYSSPMTNCSLCTRDFCGTICPGGTPSVRKVGGCNVISNACRCCCGVSVLSSSTTALGSSLFTAVQ